MKRLQIPFWSVSLWKYWDVSMGVPRTNTCQQKVRNWIDKQSWWWRLQNCCTTLLPKLCCDRSLSLEKTLQLRSLWSLGKAKRTWDEKVVKVSNGAGKVFRQKNHFQKCVFVMRVIWGLHYWVNHASHKTLSNLSQASNQWLSVFILILLNLGIFPFWCDGSRLWWWGGGGHQI